MAPKTPPQLQNSSFPLCTPSTPRYAPMDEPDQHIYDKQKQQQRQQHEPTRAQQMQSLTPAETPHSRKRGIDAISTSQPVGGGRVLFPTHTPKAGSGRVYKQPTSLHKKTKQREEVKSEPSPEKKRQSPKHVRIISPSEPPPQQSKFAIFSDARALQQEIDNEDPFAKHDDPFDSAPIGKKQKTRSSSSSTTKHPYQPIAEEEQLGMWYVFRGKKVFRPFRDGEDCDIKPRKLFKDELERLEREATPTVDSEEEVTDKEDEQLPSSPPAVEEPPQPISSPALFRNLRQPKRVKHLFR